MKKDTALIKALRKTETSKLPQGFNTRMMTAVYETAAVQKKRSQVLAFSLLSLISLSLIGLAGYLLRDYLSFNFSTGFLSTLLNPQSKTVFAFSAYIGLLVLILMFLDNYFRALHEKHLDKN